MSKYLKEFAAEMMEDGQSIAVEAVFACGWEGNQKMFDQSASLLKKYGHGKEVPELASEFSAWGDRERINLCWEDEYDYICKCIYHHLGRELEDIYEERDLTEVEDAEARREYNHMVFATDPNLKW